MDKRRELKAHEYTTDEKGKFSSSLIGGTVILIGGKPFAVNETKPPPGRLTKKEQETKNKVKPTTKVGVKGK